MKTEKQNLRKNIFQYGIFPNLMNNIILFYTKVFVKLFGDEMRTSHYKSKINVRNRAGAYFVHFITQRILAPD
ncbi:hypothetical protein, partial [Vibrio aestuarianus]|uniref:hypothetical protein n=1 Tax=Vibrio aestuarianus TaxID=28171 RepID=UPI00237D0AF4